MKMKRFSPVLHGALFAPFETETGYEGDNPQLEAQNDEAELKESVYEFSNIAEDIRREEQSRYVDEYDRKQALDRFRRRCYDKPQNSTSQDRYREIWERKVNEGFGALKQALKEHHYFDNKNLNTETQKVKDRYLKEVKRQYKDNILLADDKKFNRIKDNIFEKDSEECPANKVYKDLTGAATMFKVERRFITGYDADVLSVNPDRTTSTAEVMKDKDNIKFLSNDFPEYLWNIRKTPGIMKALNRLPFVSANVDKPSEKERKAIEDFLKASSKIDTSGDKAVALLKVFQDNNLNLDDTKEDYKRLLDSHGIKIDDKNLGDIVKAGSFYLSTQKEGNSTRDQHAIYLSVLRIIETEGGVNNVVSRYKDIVEQAKNDKKVEKKENYKDGERLKGFNPELYNLATKLGTTDYTNATRLSRLNPIDFQSFKVEEIIANISNDTTIDARDVMVGGLKTGKQFIEVFNQVGEQTALTHLLERAKLENKTLNLGLYDREFTEKQITSGNKRLILLLQNIISKPGEDLLTLLSKDTSKDPFEGIDFEKENAAAKAYAEEMKNKMDFKTLEESGLTFPSPEDMQEGLAATLYSEYTKGVGIGGKMSFNEWIQGVSINTGIQIRDDKTVVVGIGLDYSKRVNLGKGWSITPELSASAFIPLGYGKPDEISRNVGLNISTAKQRVTKKGIEHSLGFQVGASWSMPEKVVVVSSGLFWKMDKSKGIDIAEQNTQQQFEKQIIKPVLDSVYNAFKKVTPMEGESEGVIEGPFILNFNDSKIVEALQDSLKTKAHELGIEDKDIDGVVNATLRLLTSYNGADISKEPVKNTIAQKIAEQYAMAWSESRKAEISDDNGYISGAGLGAFWFVGTPIVGIYANIRRTKHELDGYGDRFGDRQELAPGLQGPEWTTEMLNEFNQQLGLSPNEQLKLNENGLVVIPKSIQNRVNVNDKMVGKGLMKRGENGDILIHKQTPMYVDIIQGSATQSKEIVVGGKEGSKSKLDVVASDNKSFTEGEINQNEVLNLGEREKSDITSLNEILEKIKGSFPEGDPIRDFNFTDDEETKGLLEEINGLPKGKKMRIVLGVDNGKIIIADKEITDGNELEIEYQSKFEMMDQNAKNIAKKVYDEALKIKNQNALQVLKGIKHKPREEYKNFRDAMKAENFTTAKQQLKLIFGKLDRTIKSNFSSVLTDLDSIDETNKAAIGQALMSINNIFARSVKVIGGDGGTGKEEYNFTVKMGDIIKEREGNDPTKGEQIKGTIKNFPNMPEDARDAYLALIDASAKYREAHPELFNIMSAEKANLENTVGFNLGDKSNPENPLFNPEIFNPMVDLDKLDPQIFTAEKRSNLHKRAMENFAMNRSLITPVLEHLGIETQEIEKYFNTDIKEKNPVRENGKLKLDIGGKIVTLGSEINFGYFTQCVNHTVILSNISAEIQGGASVIFESGVWENGVYVPATVSRNIAKEEIAVGGSFAFNTSSDSGEQDSGAKTTDDTKGGARGNTNPSDSNEVTPPPPTPTEGGGTKDSGGMGV